MIVNVVDRPRWGLFEHAKALNNYCADEGFSVAMIAGKLFGTQSSCFGQLFKIFTSFFKSDFSLVFIVWSFGPLLPFIGFLSLFSSRITAILVLHEPGGIRQRLEKGDKFLYALVLSAYEFCFKSLYTIGTPNFQNSRRYGLKYLPLIQELQRAHKPEQRESNLCRTVTFLGRKDERRFYSFFRRPEFSHELARKYQFNLKFFPDGHLKSTEQKIQLLETTVCVLNIYNVKYNQSGVISDSLAAGCPVVVSELEPEADFIKKNGLGIVLHLDLLDLDEIIRAIGEAYEIRRNWGPSQQKAVDEFCGLSAFRKWWLPHLGAHRE